jgi:hypothetical protein
LALLKRLLIALGALAVAVTVHAEPGQIASQKFGGLNNNDSPAVIDDSQAQDLLNVDITPGGKSVKKRSGFGIYKTLTGSTGIHGGIHFFDSSGNDVQVWGSSTSLWGTVGDATPVQLVSSATLNATWDCADTQGFAYCVDSSRDALIKTNGTTMTWYAAPLGTMVTVTPERLLVSGVASNPSRIYYSAANNFTNFTVGINVSDSSYEDIAAPGAKITHIRYAFGRWMWFKDQSFGYVLGTDQTNLQIVTVSNTVGTVDNSSVYYNNHLYFRGQEGHIYDYDGSNLTKLSLDISPNVQSAGRRVSNLWTQTTQSDWQAGGSSTNGAANAVNFTISPGDVTPSTTSVTDTSAVDFGSGTYVSPSVDTATVPGSITLKTYLFDQFTSLSHWSSSPTGSFGQAAVAAGGEVGCSPPGSCQAISTTTVSSDFIVQCDVRRGAAGNATDVCGALGVSGGKFVGYSVVATYATGSPTASIYLVRNTDFLAGTIVTLCSGAFTSGALDTLTIAHRSSDGFMWLYYNGAQICTAIDPTYTNFTNLGLQIVGSADIKNFYDVARTGNFTSRAFDLSFSTPVLGAFTANTSGSGVFSYATRTAATSAGVYGADTTITSGSDAASSPKRYLIYSATMTASDAVLSLPKITDVSVAAASTGTFYSQVKNAPNLSQWDAFAANTTTNGGTHTFYVRSSSNPFTVLSSTPTWVAQTNGAVVAASTGTYFQLRDDIAITAASQVPKLNDFTVNWFEGAAADKAYATYFNDAIWWSVSYGAGQSANNYIFRYDLLNSAWVLYSFGAGGFAIQNNNLYFGDTSSGNIYRFGSGTSDNGTAINSYWKSKDFSGPDPWLENEYLQLDTIARRNANQSLTVGYTLNGSTTTTSYAVSLSSTTDTTIRHKKLLPPGKIGGLLNLQFSDNSATSAWEVLGFRVKYNTLPYRPTQ